MIELLIDCIKKESNQTSAISGVDHRPHDVEDSETSFNFADDKSGDMKYCASLIHLLEQQ